MRVRNASSIAVMFLSIAALGGMRPANAGEGRTPIYAPTTIVADGKYILTRNITGSPGGPVLISIQARHVEVDLNGFTLDNTGTTQPAVAIGGDGTALESVTLRNGTLAGGSGGIVSVGGSASVLKNLVLEDLQMPYTTGTAILIRGFTYMVAIRRNQIYGANTGLWVQDVTFSPVAGVIADNSFTGTNSGGIIIAAAQGLRIANNRINQVASGNGIELDNSSGCTLEGNIVALATGIGINLTSSYGNLLRDNDVRDSGSHGIHLDPGSVDNILVRQASTHNGGPSGGDGVFIESSGNVIKDSILSRNQGAGLRFGFSASQNTFGGNTARNNTGIGIGACPLLFPPNSCDAGIENTSQGANLIPGPLAY